MNGYLVLYYCYRKISEVFKRKKAPKKSIGKKGAKVDDNDTSTGSAMIVDSVSLKGPSTPPMRTTRLGSKFTFNLVSCLSIK